MPAPACLIFALAIIIFYSGELVWRERDAQLNQVMDAFPLQRWVLFSSKLFALMLVQVLVVLLILASGLIVQIAQGYYHFELGLYFRELFLNRLTQLWILCVLAMFVQTVVNNKYLGHFVMVLYIVATIALPPAGFQDYLYRFGQTPQVTYSDMNGYGPFAAAVYLVPAVLGDSRGFAGDRDQPASGYGERKAAGAVRMSLAAARILSRLRWPARPFVVVLLLGVGGYIFYNTHILNPYRTTFKIDEAPRAVREEVSAILVACRSRASPTSALRSTSIPKSGRSSVHGTMWLENKTSSDIDRVAVTLWPVDLIPLPRPHIQVNQLSFVGGQTALIEDPTLGFYLYQLPAPLPPHGRIELDYALAIRQSGFRELAAKHRHRSQRNLHQRSLWPLHRIRARHRVDRRQHAPSPRTGEGETAAQAG